MNQQLPVQMHPKYQEFLKFMADCPHRKTTEHMEIAFWAWLKIEESLGLPFLVKPKSAPQAQNFNHGDLVRKKSGSEWQGRIVGWYSTGLTPVGYAVESDSHAGSVQIYPVNALELVL